MTLIRFLIESSSRDWQQNFMPCGYLFYCLTTLKAFTTNETVALLSFESIRLSVGCYEMILFHDDY